MGIKKVKPITAGLRNASFDDFSDIKLTIAQHKKKTTEHSSTNTYNTLFVYVNTDQSIVIRKKSIIDSTFNFLNKQRRITNK